MEYIILFVINVIAYLAIYFTAAWEISVNADEQKELYKKRLQIQKEEYIIAIRTLEQNVTSRFIQQIIELGKWQSTNRDI